MTEVSIVMATSRFPHAGRLWPECQFQMTMLHSSRAANRTQGIYDLNVSFRWLCCIHHEHLTARRAFMTRMPVSDGYAAFTTSSLPHAERLWPGSQFQMAILHLSRADYRTQSVYDLNVSFRWIYCIYHEQITARIAFITWMSVSDGYAAFIMSSLPHAGRLWPECQFQMAMLHSSRAAYRTQGVYDPNVSFRWQCCIHHEQITARRAFMTWMSVSDGYTAFITSRLPHA